MSTTIPAVFNLLAGFGSQEFSMREDIVSDTSSGAGVVLCVWNGRRVYATSNRRVLHQIGHPGNSTIGTHLRRPKVTTSATYEEIFQISATLSADTDKISFLARAVNLDIKIEIYDTSALGSIIDTLTDNTGAVELNLSDTSTTLGGDESLTLVVSIKHSGISPGELFGLQIYEESLVAADLPSEVVPSILAVQVAAGMDHIYDFDFAGTPTDDQGSAAAANLTVAGTWTHAAPSVTGAAGSYENLVVSSPNQIYTGASALDVARTEDVWFEGIYQLPAVVPANNTAMSLVGNYNQASSFGVLAWKGSVGYVQFWAPNFGLKISVTGLDATYLADPTYIAVWWDHSNTLWRIYYRKAGESETTQASVSTAAGTGGSQKLFISGNSINISTMKMRVHMFACHKGALTSTHRDNIYDVLGF